MFLAITCGSNQDWPMHQCRLLPQGTEIFLDTICLIVLVSFFKGLHFVNKCRFFQPVVK